jgi:hypothetical protein
MESNFDIMVSRLGPGRGSRIALSLIWITAAAMVAAGGGAAAHEPSSRQERASGPDGAKAASQETPKHEEIETEHIFGFTEGSSIHAPGETDLKLDSIGSFGRRGSYAHVGQKLEIHTGLPGDINLAFGLLGDFHRIRGVPGLDNVGPRYAVSGGSVELRWRFLDREKAPFGLTLLAEPSFGFIDETSGERGRGRTLETRLLFDRELVADKLFAAFNVIYETEKFRPRGVRLFSEEGEELDAPLAPCLARPLKAKAVLANPVANGEEAGEGAEAGEGIATADEAKEPCTAFARRKSAERSSQFGVSGGLTYQVLPNIFLGAEVRYMRAYEGLALQRFRGEAVFVGPTLYAKLSERLAVSAAYSAQVAGHAVDVPGRLDLDNFSRHQVRLKFLYEF